MLVLLAPAVAAQTGTISGVVVDEALGESLIGVNVQAFGAGTGAMAGGSATDLNGRYRILGLAPGAYDLVFSYLGYTRQRVTGVAVAAGETARVDAALAEEAVELGDEVVIEATMIQNSDAALLAQRARAAAVSDAVGADAIARSGSSTASDAMQQVTGASVVDGRYVFVRGLGDRYLNVQLNGAVLPSSDPDRNAVPLDLFPSGLLDNIVTSKTFTPDRPGSFTGGAVDIGTRVFPEALTVSFSASGSFDTNAAPGDDVLGIPGGGIGLLGTAEGGLPAELEDADIPNIGETFGNPAAAEELTRLSRLFDPAMAPVTESAPLEQSYSASVGNQTTLFGRPLGFVGSLNWSRNVSSYDGGRFGQYSLPGSVEDASELVPDILLATRSATDEVLWGGLVNLALRPGERHEVGLNLIYNRSAEATASYRAGSLPRDLSASQVYETRALETTERALGSAQLRGEHVLTDAGLQVEWTAALAQTAQDEPDLRYFSNHFSPGSDTTYSIAANLYPEPTRYFRNLTENSATAGVDVTVPVRLLDRALRVKVGGAFDGRSREFRERRFEFQRNSQVRYEGDSEAFFGEEGVGVVDTDASGNPIFGNYVVDLTSPRNNYDGDQTVAAGYALVDALVTERLRVIGGARLETTDIAVENFSSPSRRGEIRETDVLPALSAVYALGEGMNLRAAYGRTLARPTFREFAPYASYDFAANAIFLGNPGLERTLIDNVDVRWEWFYQPGMILAASGFYKQFDGPIERVISPQATNLEVQFRNLADATVYGAEFEARTRLGFLAGFLRDVRLGGNLTLVQSAVSIAPDELAQIRLFDPSAEDTRPLQGQSPYVLNLDLGYETVGGTSLNLYYNLFGPRLYTVARGGQPDYYEQPRAVLDVIGSQALGRGFTLKASGKNLLGSDFEITQAFKGREFVHLGYERGRSFSLGVSYRL
ncbi:MAG: TonB-dependent receptor [Rubricoccaceae bacterium]|nr:TonB-dependent receptor [Rubricoccaceae bacterium]